MLYESNNLSKDAQDSAALLTSKVYYFLREYDEAFSFALSAGNMFETENHAYGVEEYFETIVCERHPTFDLRAYDRPQSQQQHEPLPSALPPLNHRTVISLHILSHFPAQYSPI